MPGTTAVFLFIVTVSFFFWGSVFVTVILLLFVPADVDLTFILAGKRNRRP